MKLKFRLREGDQWFEIDATDLVVMDHFSQPLHAFRQEGGFTHYGGVDATGASDPHFRSMLTQMGLSFAEASVVEMDAPAAPNHLEPSHGRGMGTIAV